MINEQQIYLSVIIPAFNEAKKIEMDCRRLCQFLDRQQGRSELIVVNDGSTDRTGDLLNSLASRWSKLKVISYFPNRGKGYAVRTGVLESQGKIVLFMDAGSCVSVDSVLAGIKGIEQSVADIVLGSRRAKKSRMVGKPSLLRSAGSRVFLWIARKIMGITCSFDSQCGFKVFTGSAAREIFAENRIEGFMFDVETLLRAQRKKLKIEELPVEWHYDRDSRFNPVRGSLRNLRELLRIKKDMASWRE